MSRKKCTGYGLRGLSTVEVDGGVESVLHSHRETLLGKPLLGVLHLNVLVHLNVLLHLNPVLQPRMEGIRGVDVLEDDERGRF